MTPIETLRHDLLRRAARMIDGRYFGSGAPLPADLVQHVLSEMTENGTLATLEARSVVELRAYAFRALHHRFLNLCVRKRREGSVARDALDDAVQAPEPSPDDTALARERHAARQAALTRALSALSDDERAFLVAYVETGSAPAAQKKTGHPPGGSSNACEHRKVLMKRLQAAVQELAW